MSEKVRSNLIKYFCNKMVLSRQFDFRPNEVSAAIDENPETVVRFLRTPLFSYLNDLNGTYQYWLPRFLKTYLWPYFDDEDIENYLLHQDYGAVTRETLNNMIGVFTSPYGKSIEKRDSPEQNDTRCLASKKSIIASLKDDIKKHVKSKKKLKYFKLRIEEYCQKEIEDEIKYRGIGQIGSGGPSKKTVQRKHAANLKTPRKPVKESRLI